MCWDQIFFDCILRQRLLKYCLFGERSVFRGKVSQYFKTGGVQSNIPSGHSFSAWTRIKDFAICTKEAVWQLQSLSRKGDTQGEKHSKRTQLHSGLLLSRVQEITINHIGIRGYHLPRYSGGSSELCCVCLGWSRCPFRVTIRSDDHSKLPSYRHPRDTKKRIQDDGWYDSMRNTINLASQPSLSGRPHVSPLISVHYVPRYALTGVLRKETK